ncbi:hypothetical protein GGR54DRAFT_614207 [Hypoxylon sp. NC1633]|nr:hypothetical protein GGR54DRAFT_614207 [Hypoxylon sp. NC1633]
MALLHSRQSSASFDHSDDYSSHQFTHKGTMAPPTEPSLSVEGNKYSDQDIQILFDIVIRAEELMSDLTPSSRLPTHALFKAYAEILPRHGIDPDDDQLISKLIFIVGGVKGTDSLMEKFRVTMKRLGISVQLDIAQVYGSDASDIYPNSASTPDDLLSIASDAADRRFAVKRAADQLPGPVDGEHVDFSADDTDDHYIIPEHGDDRLDDVDGSLSKEDNSLDMSKAEQHLESSAIAFRKKHHSKFSAVSTLRQWQKKSDFISNLCDQFDAARQADLEGEVEAKFEEWRAIAIEVDNLPPQSLPGNVYSKRVEEIAIRAREIHVAKTALRRWRLIAKEHSRKMRKVEESSDPLERLAAKAHKNLMLSRAFANWSNRLEEESKRAEMAAKIYELSLKSKAFGIQRRPSDNIPIGAGDIHSTHLGTSAPAILSSPNNAPKLITPRGDSGPVITVDHAGPSTDRVDVPGSIPSEASGSKPSPDNDPSDSADEMDEITMLARRHILRMRYYEAWESYTADNTIKVRDFEAKQQDEHIAYVLPMWRSQAERASQERVSLLFNAKRANYYNRAVQALDTWRRESREKLHGQDQVLEAYAARANFYYQATKVLPIWRSESEQAIQRQGVLELYADRAEYYYKATNSIPIWREQTQHAAEHEEQTLSHYAQRADYYYKTRGTLLAWHDLAKKKRKQRLKEAHLETRRVVKKGMGERCIAQWREKLQPTLERHEMMVTMSEDVTADREWRQNMDTIDTWREKARERSEMGVMSDAMVKGKILEQWRDQSAYQQELYAEAEEHWEEKAASRALKSWNLRSLQIPDRPLMVANALEKKDRKLLRNGFERWYGQTADKLVPVELPDGSYKNVEQVVEDAQHQASLHQARDLFSRWQAAAQKRSSENVQEQAYVSTPGRPRILLGALGRRETTTPLAPVPSRVNWRASETAAMRGSLVGVRASRSGRTGRNLRVSWAQ